MTPAELSQFQRSVERGYERAIEALQQLPPASPTMQSVEYGDDALAEGIFIREFTRYESILERLFLHYAAGGASIGGLVATSYLNPTGESHVRKLTRAGWRFLSWSNPEKTRDVARLYLKDGWPICDMMNLHSQHLADCERVRNRIAHESIESTQKFDIVQRNLLGTERAFAISVGQLLRIRSVRLGKLHIRHYLDVMDSTIQAIFEPPL